jgi:periplasmic mercuric ion binding protein
MQRVAVLLVSLVVAGLVAGPALADNVELKGPHICCKQCVKIAEGLLKKVDGVSNAKADIQGKTVTFTAANEQAAKAGVQALLDGGFFGKATRDGTEIKLDVAKGEGKADAVVVEKVHVCCGQCQKAINGLFKDSKVTYEGSGPQRTVRVQGTDLDRAAVLDTLRKAGFNGASAK